jgi:hypothetical protein
MTETKTETTPRYVHPMKHRVFAAGPIGHEGSKTGYVLGMVGNDHALVQFEYPDVSQRLVAVREMLDWHFFGAEMVDAMKAKKRIEADNGAA